MAKHALNSSVLSMLSARWSGKRHMVSIADSWAAAYFRLRQSGASVILDDRRRLWIQGNTFSSSSHSTRVSKATSTKSHSRPKTIIILALAIACAFLIGWFCVPDINKSSVTPRAKQADSQVAEKPCQMNATTIQPLVASVQDWRSLGGLQFGDAKLICGDKHTNVRMIVRSDSKVLVSFSELK